MAENYQVLVAAADFIESIGKAPAELGLAVPYLGIGTLLAADALRLFVNIMALGQAPADAEQLVRRALSDNDAIKAAMNARETALEDAMKGA